MGFIAVSMFTVNIALDRTTASPWAFFGLAPRAWEFAVAGLGDRSAARSRRSARRGSTGAWQPAVGALGLVAAPCALLDGQTPVPAALPLCLPVVGTMLRVGGRATDCYRGKHSVQSACSASRRRSYLGRLSYSWYLWHWPFIVLLTGALYRDTIPLRLLAALIALPVAAVSYMAVENPVRFSRRLRTSRPRTYALGAAATMICLVAAFGVYRHTQSELSQPPYRGAPCGQRELPPVRVRGDHPLAAATTAWRATLPLARC